MDSDLSSCYDTRAIHIHITPIGPNSQYRKQYRVVSSLTELPLYELSRPSSWNWKTRQTFQFATWDKGSLIFEYSNPNDQTLNNSYPLKVYCRQLNIVYILKIFNKLITIFTFCKYF